MPQVRGRQMFRLPDLFPNLLEPQQGDLIGEICCNNLPFMVSCRYDF